MKEKRMAINSGDIYRTLKLHGKDKVKEELNKAEYLLRSASQIIGNLAPKNLFFPEIVVNSDFFSRYVEEFMEKTPKGIILHHSDFFQLEGRMGLELMGSIEQKTETNFSYSGKEYNIPELADRIKERIFEYIEQDFSVNVNIKTNVPSFDPLLIHVYRSYNVASQIISNMDQSQYFNTEGKPLTSKFMKDFSKELSEIAMKSNTEKNPGMISTASVALSNRDLVIKTYGNPLRYLPIFQDNFKQRIDNQDFLIKLNPVKKEN